MPRAGEFQLLAPGADGIPRSEVCPGLWLHVAALLRGDMPRVLATVQQGSAGPEHVDFVRRLGAHGPS